MSTALSLRPETTPTIWQAIQAIAPTLHQSRLYGVTSPEQAMAIMLAGHELGLGFTASFELIHVVSGKPSLSPRGALTLILHSGELAEMKIDETPGSCTVYMRRRNGLEYRQTWTLDDAKRAGLVKPGGAYEHYPQNMLKWRALGYVADVLFPDLFAGLKRADEFGADLDEDGNVARPTSNDKPAQSPTVIDQVVADSSLTEFKTEPVTLDWLLEHYGAEAILAWNEGKIPETPAELESLAVKLDLLAPDLTES